MALEFQIAGIPIRVRAEFFIGGVLLGASRISQPVLLAEWIAIVGLSVILHELGHAFTYRAFGHSPRIELHAFGGLTFGSPGVPLAPKRDVLVSLAGPLAGLAFGGLVWGAVEAFEIEPASPIAAQIIEDILWVNIGWSVLNLLPIVPLDGGHVLQASLRHFIAERTRADKIAAVVSVVVAAGAAVLAWTNEMRFAAYLAIWFGAGSVRALFDGKPRAAGDGEENIRKLLAEQKYGDALAAMRFAPDPRAIDPALRGYVLFANGLRSEAIDPLSEAFFGRGDADAGALLAEVLLETKQLDKAFALIGAREAKAIDDRVQGRIEAALFEAGRFEDALAVSEMRFDRFRSADAAYNAACSLARLGRAEDALRWLERAAGAGYRDLEHFERDADLAEVRARFDVERLRERMRANAGG